MSSSSSSSRTPPATSGNSRAGTVTSTSGTAPVSSPSSPVPQAVTTLNSSSNMNPRPIIQPCNSNIAPVGTAINGMSSLSLSSSTTATHDPPSGNSPPRKRRALRAPAGFNNKFLQQAVAAVLPNGSASDQAVLVAYLQLVIRELPLNITSDAVEAHLQESGLLYFSASVNQIAAKAIIKFLSNVDHLMAATHAWPWGTVCQKSVDAPYTDFEGSNRLTFSVPVCNMSSPRACFAGALASLGAIVEGGNWSEAKPDNFNVYVETLDCARNVFRFRENFVIEDTNGGKDSTVLLKRDKCALAHSTLAKVFVGSIRGDLTEFDVEDTFFEVLKSANLSLDNFIYFAVHRGKKASDNKASNFGFAHVVGSEVARFLCLSSTQHGYRGRFTVKAVKEDAKK